VAVLAFVAGVAVAAVVLFFVFARGDGEGGDQQVVATSTARMTPAATIDSGATPIAGSATPTPGPPATATPAVFQDPDAALAAFVRDELGSEYIGPCPQELAPGEEPPQGYCSIELYRSEELATFIVGRPFSEGIGEAVLTRSEDGFWSMDFVQAPPLGEIEISVGSEAVVFGAGDCLNFREEPSLSAEALWCLIDGTSARVVEGPIEADGHTWWRLEGLGWASEQYLVPVAE
jgi:hypothetical protein